MDENFLAEQIADLWCPIAARCVDRASREHAQTEALAWAQQVGLVRSRREQAWVAAWNVAEFAGRVYVGADDLSLAAQWITWMDVIDDAVETLSIAQVPMALAPITRILRTGDPAAARSGPLAVAFADLWRRTQAGMSAMWRTRFADTWEECAEAVPWEAANRSAGRAPSLDAYVAHRATAGAAYLAILLNEALEKYELPPMLYHSGPLSSLRSLACDHICWVNDLLSLDREERHGDVHNLVIVLGRSCGFDRQSAIRETVRMANERMRTIMQLAHGLPGYQSLMGLSDDEKRLMDRSVDCILQWIAGSLDFHRLSSRHVDHRTGHANPFRDGEPSGEPHAGT